MGGCWLGCPGQRPLTMGRKFTVIFEQFCCTIDVGEFVRQPPKDRFLSKVRIDEVGCWIWTASRNNQGYGNFKLAGEVVRAHHAAYLLFVGPILEGQVVRHSCDIKLCVNPEHLILGTSKDNSADMVERGHSMRKLSPGQVEMVRRSKSLGATFLAKVLSVSVSTIRNIWSCKTYNATTAVPSPQTPSSAVNAEGKENGE